MTDSTSTRWTDLCRQESAASPSPAARNLALAHHIDRLVERGVIADYTRAAGCSS